MSDISPIKPDKAVFASQYQRGMKIFEDSLTNYHATPKSPNTVEYKKKSLFGQAMDDAMKAMHDSSSRAFGKSLQAKEKQLEQDYQQFLKTGSEEDYNKLKVDLQDIKNNLPY